MKVRFRSFRMKLWLYFVLFTALIFIVLWLLQTVFIQNFYNDIGSAHKSLNVAPEAQKENEQPVLSNNKTLNKSNKTLSN